MTERAPNHLPQPMGPLLEGDQMIVDTLRSTPAAHATQQETQLPYGPHVEGVSHTARHSGHNSYASGTINNTGDMHSASIESSSNGIKAKVYTKYADEPNGKLEVADGRIGIAGDKEAERKADQLTKMRAVDELDLTKRALGSRAVDHLKKAA